MKLGVITDGISRDFERALAVMDEFGLDHAELQYLWDKEVGVPCPAATAGCQATSPSTAAPASSALRRVTLPRFLPASLALLPIGRLNGPSPGGSIAFPAR